VSENFEAGIRTFRPAATPNQRKKSDMHDKTTKRNRQRNPLRHNYVRKNNREFLAKIH